MTGHTYACNSLRNFEYEGHAMTGKGNHVNLLKLAWKKLLKSHHFSMILADFSHWEPLCGVVPGARALLWSAVLAAFLFFTTEARRKQS